MLLSIALKYKFNPLAEIPYLPLVLEEAVAVTRGIG